MFNFNEEKKETTFALAKNVEIPTNKRGNINTVVIGNKESDKFNSFIIPNIERCLGSYVIADYNNEIFNNTNQALSNNGYKIINIDLETNSIYNPFMYIENELDAQILSHIIVKQNAYKSEDVFKEDMCEIIFRIIAQYSLKMLPKEKQNLYYCLKILKELKDNNAKYLQFVMSKLDSSAEIMKYYDTIGKISDESYHLLLEILENKLNSLGELTTFSSTNFINFEEIATTRTALYVNISSKQNINAIFFTQLTQKLFNYADNNHGYLDVPTFFILDNFERLGNIITLSMKMATSRSRKMAFYVIFDNIEEISSTYHKDTLSILKNCDLALYLGTKNEKTMSYISDNLDGNVSVKEFVELHDSMCITYEKGIAPIKAIKYGKATPSQNELNEFYAEIENQKQQAKAQENENRKQQNLDLIKDLENKLQNETDPLKREELEKALKAMKLVIDIDNKY